MQGTKNGGATMFQPGWVHNNINNTSYGHLAKLWTFDSAIHLFLRLLALKDQALSIIHIGEDEEEYDDD